MRLRLAALPVVLAAALGALGAACGARADLDPYGVPVRKSASQQSSAGAAADAGSDGQARDAESDAESE